jgi:hypothetical protein
MGTSSRVIISAVLAAAAASAQAQPLIRGDKQIQLTLHPGEMKPAVAEQVIDGCWQATEKLNALLKKVRRPKKWPRVELYADEAAYRMVEKKSSPYAFRVQAFCDHESNVAYVAVPKLGDASFAVLGAPASVRHAVIRMAAKLVALENGVGRRDPWLADVVSFAVLDELENPERAWGVDPLFDKRSLILRARTETG